MLAINGGMPVRNTFLPYGQQLIDDEDIQAVVKTLKSDFLTTGPKVKEFECVFAETVGAKYAVAVSNCTAALHIACLAANIKANDEVIMTPITFAASANCVLYCGGTPVFSDIEPNTYNIAPEDIEQKITSRTKAIIPVHFTGEPCEMDKIVDIAKKYNLMIIEDAAHALGGIYHGRKIGSISDMTCFSLHPVKNITTGEGGVVTTDNIDLYEKLLLYRSHGITRNLSFTKENPWYYEQVELGFNYRLTDIQCALGISQLGKLDRFNQRREEIVCLYNRKLQNVDGVKLKKPIENIVSGNHLYIIQLETEKLHVDRNTVFNALRAENIGVNLHYIPVYWHPYYQKSGYKKGLCPNAECLYERMITIPLFQGMTDQDAEDVVTAVIKVVKAYHQ